MNSEADKKIHDVYEKLKKQHPKNIDMIVSLLDDIDYLLDNYVTLYFNGQVADEIEETVDIIEIRRRSKCLRTYLLNMGE